MRKVYLYLHRDPTVDRPTSFLSASRLPIAMPLTVISLCLYYDRPYRLDWKNYICRLEAIFRRNPPKATTATASFLLVGFIDLLAFSRHENSIYALPYELCDNGTTYLILISFLLDPNWDVQAVNMNVNLTIATNGPHEMWYS